MKKSIFILFLFPFFLFAQEDKKTSELTVEEIFTVVEDMPHFSGCEDVEDKKNRNECASKKLEEFIYEHLTYPLIARQNGVTGTVIINFIVTKDGSLSNINIKKDIGAGCGKEALRVVNLMNKISEKWKSGKQREKPVNVYYNLPIQFNLEDNKPRFIFLNSEVDEKPIFPSCEKIKDDNKKKLCSRKKMLEFLYMNIKYPLNARDQGVEGTVVIRFVITRDGKIINPEIMNDIGGGCGKEALRVVEMMKDLNEKWTPAKKDGKTVDSYFDWPAKFRLQG